MVRMSVSPGRTGVAVFGPHGTRPLRRLRPIVRAPTVKSVIRYTFYGFIFSLPFEQAVIAGGATLPKFLGLALAVFGLLQPHLCYKFPPRALWWFASYLLVFFLWSLYLCFIPSDVPDLLWLTVGQFIKFGQLLVLFWICYNLFRQEQVVNRSLWALIAGTLLLALLQLSGVTSEVAEQGRVTAFDANPNGLATVLSLGLLALFGVAYGRERRDWKGRVLFWSGSGILAIAVVQTGSRGALLALGGSLAICFLKGKSLATKLKFGAIGLMSVVVLAVASYRIEAVRARWERTFYDEGLAGREKIYLEAVGMILESPVVGWGPVNHLWEFGPRVGKPYRDEHNVYLWILAEVGLLGGVPFFIGLWLCWRTAWKARHGLWGVLPLVMLVFLLIVSMKGTLHRDKYFWVVLSFALAAHSYIGGSWGSERGLYLNYLAANPTRRKSGLSTVLERGRSGRLARHL